MSRPLARVLAKVMNLLDDLECDQQEQAMALLRTRYPSLVTVEETAEERVRRLARDRQRLSRLSRVTGVTGTNSSSPVVSLLETQPTNGSKNRRPHRDDAIEALNFLNKLAERTFRPVDTNLLLIESRMASGATLQNCKGVIARKVREWKTDPKMSKYLRPETLFAPKKFESYLGEREPEMTHGT